MSNQPNNLQPIASLSHIIFFHGINLIVRKYQNTEYVPLKPIVESIGIDWRNIKRNMENADNQQLYGAVNILSPEPDVFTGHMTQEKVVENFSNDDSEHKSTKNMQFSDLFCIRLDRVTMFLARVNTSKVRASGNESTADYLLFLQQEWADALHDYESTGIAVNKTVFDNTKQLKVLVDIYSKLTDKQQKLIISKQIDHALGVHRSDNGGKQLDMLDKQGG